MVGDDAEHTFMVAQALLDEPNDVEEGCIHKALGIRSSYFKILRVKIGIVPAGPRRKF